MRVAILPNGVYVNSDVIFFLEHVDFEFDTLITSPPYWMQRVYHSDSPSVWPPIRSCDGEHEWKEYSLKFSALSKMAARKEYTGDGYEVARFKVCPKCLASIGQLGNEPFPELYVQHLALILSMAMNSHASKKGTAFVNISDTYRGSKIYYPDADSSIKSIRKMPTELLNIPYQLTELLSEHNVYFRQDIIWSKVVFDQSSGSILGSSLAESVTTRFRNAFEHVLFFTVAPAKNYFSEIESRLPIKIDSVRQMWRHSHKAYEPDLFGKKPLMKERFDIRLSSLFKGRLIPNVIKFKWDYKKATGHFARMPVKMYELLMKVGAPVYVCAECGEPFRYEFKYKDTKLGKLSAESVEEIIDRLQRHDILGYFRLSRACSHTTTRKGIAFDPFAGLGTIHRVKDRFTISTEISETYFDEGVAELKEIYPDLKVMDLTTDEISSLIKRRTVVNDNA